MIEGLFGISYSTNKIGEDGRFIDSALESDFRQTRYSILRNPERKGIVDESTWRKGGLGARMLFLKMVDSANSRPLNQFGLMKESEEDPDGQTNVWTYHTGCSYEEGMQGTTETVIVASEVEEIPDGMFKDFKNLKSVVIGEGLRRIGKNAFENCTSLTNIRLNGVEYIGDKAFVNCSGLVAVELGSDVQHIGMGAFMNCSGLAAVTIPPNVTFIGDYAFSNCPSLKQATVMDGVAEVSAYCFQNDVALEQAMLPSSIEKVGERAFENCPECEVYVPTMDREEAEELLGVKMVAKAEDDDTILKCDQGYVVRLYKDLY